MQVPADRHKTVRGLLWRFTSISCRKSKRHVTIGRSAIDESFAEVLYAFVTTPWVGTSHLGTCHNLFLPRSQLRST